MLIRQCCYDSVLPSAASVNVHENSLMSPPVGKKKCGRIKFLVKGVSRINFR